MELAFEISKCPPKKFCQKLIRIHYGISVHAKLFPEKSFSGWVELAEWADFLLKTNKWSVQRGSKKVPKWIQSGFPDKSVPNKRRSWKIFPI